MAPQLEPYQQCVEHIAGQMKKLQEQEEKLAPIRAAIRTASDEESSKILEKYGDILDTTIPLIDLNDDKGKQCSQVLEINRQAMLRKATERKN